MLNLIICSYMANTILKKKNEQNYIVSFQIINWRNEDCVSLVLTLTFALGKRGTYPGVDSASLFLCWVSLPIRATTWVLRCRRNRVLFCGMDRIWANNSALNRGSRTWGSRTERNANNKPSKRTETAETQSEIICLNVSGLILCC